MKGQRLALRLIKALRFAIVLMASFILVSGVWNAARIGISAVLVNLTGSLLALALYTAMITIVAWVVFELNDRASGS